MKEIQYEIVKEIAVLSTGDSGYTKEINLIAWNGNEPKYDIRSFSPAREKCGKGITLTKAEAEKLLAALKKELKQRDFEGRYVYGKDNGAPENHCAGGLHGRRRYAGIIYFPACKRGAEGKILSPHL